MIYIFSSKYDLKIILGFLKLPMSQPMEEARRQLIKPFVLEVWYEL